MAKKRRKHRRPKAPPVHSAPESVEPTRVPATASAETPPEAPVRRPRPRRPRRSRSTRGRVIAAVVVVGALIIGAVVFQQIQSRRAANEHAALASAAGCGEIQDVGGLDRDHVDTPVDYETSPPAGGAHDQAPLPARVYEEPFSTTPGQSPTIYQAVHSLEHGYIIAWHDGLADDERTALERELRAERKAIVVPYPDLEEGQHMALSAWGKLQICEEADPAVATSFLELFREQTGPEPEAA